MFARCSAAGLALAALLLASFHGSAEAAAKKKKNWDIPKLVTVTYPVADLISPIETDQMPGKSATLDPIRYLFAVRTGADKTAPQTVQDALMKLIQSSVSA